MKKEFTIYAESTDGRILAIDDYDEALRRIEPIKRVRKHAKIEEYIVDEIIEGADFIRDYYNAGLLY